jgi:hypothetical protein
MAKAPLSLEIELELRDKNGKLLSRKRFKSHSFVRNFLKILRASFATTSKVASVDRTASSNYGYVVANKVPSGNVNAPKSTGNVASDLYVAWGAMIAGGNPLSFYFGGLDAPSGDPSFGIVAGYSDQAVSVDDYNLISPYTHGSGAGKLSYGQVTVEDVAAVGGTTRLRLIRTFTNDHTESQTVREIGLIYKGTSTYTGSQYEVYPSFTMFLIARDVLGTPQTIPSGATLTVRYIFSTTV